MSGSDPRVPVVPIVPIAPFDPSDAWLLQAVLYAGGLIDGAELRDVIGLGDGIRDALFTADELRGGFARLTAAGFLRAEEGRWFVVGEARGLAKREGLSLAEHRAEIESFLGASNYRGNDPDEADPALSDERIREATQAYLALFQGGAGGPEPVSDPAADSPPGTPPDPTTIH